MNKAQLIENVAGKLGKETTKAAAERAVNSVIESIVEGIKKDGSVQFVGFGTFSVVKRAARKGVNPLTGKPVQIAARQSVKFKPGSALKEAATKTKLAKK